MPRSSDTDLPPAPNEDWLRAIGRECAGHLHVLSVVLLGAACALLMWSAVWMAHPRSYDGWRDGGVVSGLLCAAGPLAAAWISARALVTKNAIQSRAHRFIVAVAIAVPVSIALLFVTLARLIDSGALNSEADFPIVAGLGLVLGMAVVGAIRLLLPDHATSQVRERIMHSVIVASVGLPIAGLPLWSVLNIALVEWRASAIAGSAPYCLQVPAGSIDYNPVTRWSELSGLRMQAPFEESGGATAHEWQWAFHAVLVVKRHAGNEFYNWSYYAQNFVPLSKEVQDNTHVSADCEPKSGFLYTLDAF